MATVAHPRRHETKTTKLRRRVPQRAATREAAAHAATAAIEAATPIKPANPQKIAVSPIYCVVILHPDGKEEPHAVACGWEQAAYLMWKFNRKRAPRRIYRGDKFEASDRIAVIRLFGTVEYPPKLNVAEQA